VKVVECKSDLMKILVGHIVTIVIVYNCEGCYCHNLSFSRGMLLSQLVKSEATIVIVDDDK
jgi:CO dehydrogenase nickel-insertion accessory protein CooC1